MIGVVKPIKSCEKLLEFFLSLRVFPCAKVFWRNWKMNIELANKKVEKDKYTTTKKLLSILLAFYTKNNFNISSILM